MTLDEFAALFEECVEFPLSREGFERFRKTKSLVLTRDYTQVSLIRLGGKLTRPGCTAQIICFRHTFLRPIDTEHPVEFTLRPSDYPYKWRLRNFGGFAIKGPRYRPENLGKWKVDRYCFESRTRQEVQKDLTRHKDTLINKVLPWSSRLTPFVAAEQIRKYGEDAWCEKRWIEDYERHLAAPLP